MSDAIAGVGTLFRRWSGSAWVNISEINSITNTKTRETIDVTSLDSMSGYREFITSFRDGGSMALSMNFTRSTYDTMNDDFEDNDSQNYEIMLPDAENTSFEFVGYVTEIGLGISTDDKVSADVTIKVTGQTTTESGSGSS